MVDFEMLTDIDESNLTETAQSLDKEDLPKIVERLSEKNDKVRYKALLLLQKRSACCDDVYPFWDVFRSKLKHENSYQRNIGVMLIAENAKWDTENRMDGTIDEYLTVLNDEKPITVRQCIQALEKIVPYKNHLCPKIADSLMSINILAVKETMRKLILFDILNILVLIRKYQPADASDEYIINALSGEVLDKKVKKLVEQRMRT